MDIFAFLQRLGKSLMLPVSILPVAGIFLGVSHAEFSFIPSIINSIMYASGSAIFGNIPLLFMAGTTLGLAHNSSGAAILAGIVGYAVMLSTLGILNSAYNMGLDSKIILGITTIDTGVLGGIIAGILAATMYNKYHKIQLPAYLGFFAGKRFVPIATAFAAVIASIPVILIWGKVSMAMQLFSDYAVYKSPTVMGFIYGFTERLLIPLGIHHIWNVPFQMQMGEFATSSGNIVHGDIARFFAGDPTAGFLAGGYLVKMFGLPAAALAILHCAYKENKPAVTGLLLSAAFTSFLTGITEPIEFIFLFAAPVLYFIHAVFTGCAFMITNYFGIKMSTSFSNGLIDYVLCFDLATKPVQIIYWGLLFAAVYYCSFVAAIKIFKLKLIGREDPTASTTKANQPQAEDSNKPENHLTFANKIIQSLGGKDNIISVDACITRLRMSLHDISLVKKDEITNLGATAVIPVGNNLQAIFGTKSEEIKTEIKEAMTVD
jgi:PTS system glucose-specific IIC component